MTKPAKHLYEFGHFRLDTAERLLLRDQSPVPLTPKVFETLLALVERSGQLVEKDELIREVWPDAFVEESNLTQNISVLRRALGEHANGQRYIETVPKRGYRFVASVREVRDEQPSPAAEISFPSEAVTTAKEEVSPRHEIESEPMAVSAAQVLAASVGKSSGGSRRQSLTAVVICLFLAGLTIALTFAWKSARREKDEPLAGIKSIAVLPFNHLDGAGGEQALELGMADALITKLSSTQKINVRPTRAILKYADQAIDPLAAGRELNVDALLFGSIQESGDKMRVTVQR